MPEPQHRDLLQWVVLAFLIVTIALAIGLYARVYSLRYTLGPFTLTHWLSWGGALFVALFTPVYFALRHRGHRGEGLVYVHMIGNLTAFLLVTLHFTVMVRGLDLEGLSTGIVLFLAMALLVATGVNQRYHYFKGRSENTYLKPHVNRFLHVATTITFYLIIVVHVVRGLEHTIFAG